MAQSNHYSQYLFVAVAVAALLAVGEASCVGFDLHHRSSPVVRRWAEARGHTALAAELPAKGSLEYYSELSRHDRALLARRSLAGAADGLLTFADGNATIQNIGLLYYAEVELGTPNTTFLVALDTGSDLLWVPCDCKQCASIRNVTGQDIPNLRPYSPGNSSTSKQVTCDSTFCEQPVNTCSAAAASNNGSCPYVVSYVSANTSSSGVLVEDVVHLTREAPGPGAATEALQATIVFGCGQVQTGAFLTGAGFDGLLGLGMDNVSVPSVLAASGVVASNSFSMCFSDDGVGRINFGDAGSAGQSETPFVLRSTNPTYNVSFTSVNVGSETVAVEFAAVVDSGTSFTYLNDPEYTALATSFNSQVRERRIAISGSSFDYCYQLNPNQTEVLLPDVSLTTAGGAKFPATMPVIVLGDEVTRLAVAYCLAMLKNDITTNIIGQNFMTGLKVVFNREKSVLGWEKFDCYKNARVADAPGASPGPAPAGPNPTKITPQQTDTNRNNQGASPGSAGSIDAAGALGGGLSLLLPLLVSAALV